VKWLRTTQETVTLAAARKALTTLTGGGAPASAAPSGELKPLGHVRSAGPVVVPESPLKRQLMWIGVLLVLVVAAGWWTVKHPRGNGVAAPAAVAPQGVEDKRLAAVNARAVALVAEAAAGPADSGSESGTVFQVADSQKILNERGKVVVVEGVVLQVRAAEKTLFVEFAGAGPQVRGYLLLKDATGGLAEEALAGLVGKRVRISGVVRVAAAGKARRPEVLIKDRKSIQEVP